MSRPALCLALLVLVWQTSVLSGCAGIADLEEVAVPSAGPASSNAPTAGIAARPVSVDLGDYGTCGDFSRAGYRGGQQLPNAPGTPEFTFGPGRHVIKDQVILTSNMVLKGAGSDRTTLHFPNGLTELTGSCINHDGQGDAGSCWSWWGGLITASGREVGIEGVTIEFPPHSFRHYNRTFGAQPGYNGIEFKDCTNCWARDVIVVNSDVGILAKRSKNITIENTTVQANARGSHIHYGVNERSRDVLIRGFMAIGRSEHGMVSNWGSAGAFVDGRVSGGAPLEPIHACAVPNTSSLYQNIHGEIGPVRKFRCKQTYAVLVDVNGDHWQSDACLIGP